MTRRLDDEALATIARRHANSRTPLGYLSKDGALTLGAIPGLITEIQELRRERDAAVAALDRLVVLAATLFADDLPGGAA